MKISNLNSIGSTSKAKKKDKTSGGNFSAFLDAEIEETQAPASLMSVSAVSFINEVGDIDPEERKKQMIERGNDLLDDLEKIRDDLVFGTRSPAALQNILNKLEVKREKIDDPKLEELINEIEVRASVELAKLGLI
ncbi:MAG: hypothetical protein COV36_06475 [Alphaproteobacteria bacterium CG11_big_fil_rev_8_21_14_0_20_44_7]|nr:MAG: hypothetical protein COV36_06475 [Alphaproteobacteria bacterium CG11_big_fil_rev_8_21_14_0_20_44_7]